LVPPGRGTVQHAGVIRRESGMPDHIHFNKRMDSPEVMERKQYFAVTAACAIMPKQLFLELGGFDEAYWCGWEDMDLCQKIHRAGYRIYYEPKSLVYHYESRTEGRYAKEDSNFGLYMSRWELGGDKNGQQKNSS
jgi:GT2 family glycosyltransferase